LQDAGEEKYQQSHVQNMMDSSYEPRLRKYKITDTVANVCGIFVSINDLVIDVFI